MQYWLFKSEPNTYSWDKFVGLGKDMWDGVRNYQARNNMRTMAVGDLGLFYHSVHEKQVVGVMRVVKAWYNDPTTEDTERWSVVDVAPICPFPVPVTLDQIKADPRFEAMVLVNNSRLSVQPVTETDFFAILDLGKVDAAKLQ